MKPSHTLISRNISGSAETAVDGRFPENLAKSRKVPSCSLKKRSFFPEMSGLVFNTIFLNFLPLTILDRLRTTNYAGPSST